MFLRGTPLGHGVQSFYALLGLLCRCFVEDFCVYVHGGCWSVVCFCSVIGLTGFGVRVTLASWSELGSLSSLP